MAKKRKFMSLCPACGQLLYHRAQVQDIRYGSPFQSCPGCGAEYFDYRFREPGLEARHHVDRLPKSTLGSLLLGAAFLLGAVYLDRKLEMALMGALFLGAALYFAVTFWRSSEERHRAFQEELTASRLRLKDPEYVDRLRANGIKVPDFLPDERK